MKAASAWGIYVVGVKGWKSVVDERGIIDYGSGSEATVCAHKCHSVSIMGRSPNEN